MQICFTSWKTVAMPEQLYVSDVMHGMIFRKAQRALIILWATLRTQPVDDRTQFVVGASPPRIKIELAPEHVVNPQELRQTAVHEPLPQLPCLLVVLLKLGGLRRASTPRAGSL